MTGELSLFKGFRADKTNLLACEIIQKETVPGGHCREVTLTGRRFQALGLGWEAGRLLRSHICTWVRLFTGMGWCNELLIRSAWYLTPVHCGPAPGGRGAGGGGRGGGETSTPTGAGKHPGNLPGMPQAAFLSQHDPCGPLLPLVPFTHTHTYTFLILFQSLSF